MADEAPIWTRVYHHPQPWDRPFPPMSGVEMFRAAVARRGDAPLHDFMGRQRSYVEVGREADRVAKGLQAMGVGKGDRVGLFLPNLPHYVAAYYGAMIAGATVVNFSPLYTVDELAHQVEDSGTTILFTASAQALLPTALAVLDKSSLARLIVGHVAEALPAPKSLLYRLFKRAEIAAVPNDARVTEYRALIANDGKPAPIAIDPETDIALLQYTGGTTGVPKGAMITHQNLTANARQVCAIDPHPEADDRILGVLPFFHVFANTCVLNRTINNGGTIYMLPRFNAADAIATISRGRITAMPGVPTMYQALLDHPDIGKADFSHMRACISGGAPLPLELKKRFEERTQAKLIEGYGLTESSGVVSSNPYEGLNKPGTIGQPVPATLVRLVDKEDPTRDAPPGEPGELCFKGPQVMKGYWNRPDADAEVFIDGWLRTGDVATIDADGFVAIVDRLKDMIAVGGFKVFPSQIEDILYRHDAVKEALVIGVPDPYRGESPRAFVTLAEGHGESGQELTDWLNPQLGKHERVDGVVVRDALPKTMIGKLDRKALRKEVGVA